jgi:chemotaxis protein MotA
MQFERIDLATVLGLVSGFGLILIAILLGGGTSDFIDLPAVLIVCGGTFAITLISFSIPEVIRAQAVMLKTLTKGLPDISASALRVMELAERARRDGVLVLQNNIDDPDQDEFLSKALSLTVDGIPSEELDRILRREISSMSQRHVKSADIYRKAAEVAPAMGLIGTLIGLVKMLANLNDPSAIGPAMAVALLTTFYGACMATMFFSPLATKLERSSEDEVMLQSVYLLGMTSISRRENPRRLEMLINTLLPPAKRIRYFD